MNKSAKKVSTNRRQIRPETYVVSCKPTNKCPVSACRKGTSRPVKGPSVHVLRSEIKVDSPKQLLPCIDIHNLGMNRSHKRLSNPPIDMRMAIRLNKIDEFKEKSKKPLPSAGLPKWDKFTNSWPLDAKIPDLRERSWPPGLIYFTRGRLNKPLILPRKEFDLSDPKGYKKTYQLSDYNALHDPHTKSYFKQKSVQRVLFENDLISNRGDVICNAKDYNRFRTYVSTLQNEGVNEKLQKEDERLEFERKVYRSFQAHKHNEQNGGTSERLEKALKIKEDSEKLKISKAKSEKFNWDCQVEAFEMWKREERFLQIQDWPEADYVTKFRREKVKSNRNEERRRLLGKSVYDMKRAAYNIKYDKLILKVLKERSGIDKIIKLKKRDEQSLELKEVIDETVRLRKAKWRKRYDRQIEFAHKNYLAMEAAKKEKAAHERRLERKYWDLWRAFVQKQRDRRDDAGHSSAFKVHKKMKELVADLEEVSGYNPKQNFFMQLLNNRRTIGEWAGQQELIVEQNQKKKRGKKPKNNDDANLADAEADDIHINMLTKSATKPSTNHSHVHHNE